MLMMLLLVTDSCAELVNNCSTIPDILWNFYRIKDTKKRLTLMDNPHFYAKLPESWEAYERTSKIYPAKKLSRVRKFSVLTDRPELVYIITDQVTLTFGNFWRSKNGLIFKGLSIPFVFLPLFLTSSQTSVGGSARKPLSRHLSEAHSVGSVTGFWCPPIQELPGIALIWRQLLQRDTHRPGNV